MGILEVVVAVLIIVWLLGLGTGYTLGGLIHILLLVAAIVILIRVIQGHSVL